MAWSFMKPGGLCVLRAEPSDPWSQCSLLAPGRRLPMEHTEAKLAAFSSSPLPFPKKRYNYKREKGILKNSSGIEALCL